MRRRLRYVEVSSRAAAPCSYTFACSTACRRRVSTWPQPGRDMIYLGKGPDDPGPSSDFLHQPFQRIVRPDFAPMAVGEAVIAEGLPDLPFDQISRFVQPHGAQFGNHSLGFPGRRRSTGSPSPACSPAGPPRWRPARRVRTVGLALRYPPRVRLVHREDLIPVRRHVSVGHGPKASPPCEPKPPDGTARRSKAPSGRSADGECRPATAR